MADISDIIADRQWIDSPSAEPMAVFDAWLGAAEAHELNDPNAMALATSQNDMPNVRMVLLKGHDARGFVFYTNLESVKGAELAANGKASLCFHWKSLQRQVRVQGLVSPVRRKKQMLIIIRAAVAAVWALGRRSNRAPWLTARLWKRRWPTQKLDLPKAIYRARRIGRAGGSARFTLNSGRMANTACMTGWPIAAITLMRLGSMGGFFHNHRILC